jgi:hypothetical protein
VFFLSHLCVAGGYQDHELFHATFVLLQGIRTTGRWYLRPPYFIAVPDHGLGPDRLMVLPPGIQELDVTGGGLGCNGVSRETWWGPKGM